MSANLSVHPDATRLPIPATEAALFLDLDGSIVPLAERPDAVTASLPCRIVLRWAIEQLEGRVAMVSGRTIDSVDHILNGVAPCVAGVHGLQRRSLAGGLAITPPHEGIADAVEIFEALARAQSGLLIEAKGPSVAIHYRAAPTAELAVLEAAERVAAASGLAIQRGHMVVELRTPGPDKGAAVNAFMREAPFAGARPIFIGDDLTDEAGFAAARALGGVGVVVGSRQETAANARLADPTATLSWIVRSLDAGEFDTGQCQ